MVETLEKIKRFIFGYELWELQKACKFFEGCKIKIFFVDNISEQLMKCHEALQKFKTPQKIKSKMFNAKTGERKIEYYE